MALSAKAKRRLEVALARRDAAVEIAAAIDAAAPHAPAAHVANVTTADATDLASAEALANANKATINQILASLQAAGLMA